MSNKKLGFALDVEGTLVNNEPAHHGGWIRAAAEIGVHLASPEEAIEKCPNFSGGPDRDTILQIHRLVHVVPNDDQVAHFLARKWFHYDELVSELDLRPRPGFYEFLGRARGAGIPVTLGTAVDLDRALALLRSSGLDHHFLLRDIVLNSDVEHSKPAPDIFLETARRMGIDPKDQIVFEDSPRGVKSGVTAGSVVIGIPVYDTPTVKDNLLDAGAKIVITDWRDVNIDDFPLSGL